ncbi:hypothetical protein CDL15_Pgr022028 [Punica granatum]|uniref:Retrovirus-related Pol polyprotein from transposon TNT 1-94-like beta-barrel domain-containing protein n=1 Tax=Punica granatum TaxID=22663 RepID=A0A218VSG6_PUNGR|nr:hypothetical protein CDL15_Pgr022028 [Punica granatum]
MLWFLLKSSNTLLLVFLIQNLRLYLHFLLRELVGNVSNPRVYAIRQEANRLAITAERKVTFDLTVTGWWDIRLIGSKTESSRMGKRAKGGYSLNFTGQPAGKSFSTPQLKQTAAIAQPEPVANSAQASSNISSTSQNRGTTLAQLSDAEFQCLLSIVTCTEEESVPHSGNTFITLSVEWAIDSGAARHMTSNLNLFAEWSNLDKPIPIHIPNGSTVPATKTGRVDLGVDQGEFGAGL